MHVCDLALVASYGYGRRTLNADVSAGGFSWLKCVGRWLYGGGNETDRGNFTVFKCVGGWLCGMYYELVAGEPVPGLAASVRPDL